MIQSLKYILLTLITCMLTLTASAQKEEDFASRYMTLYAQGTSLECTTLSPDMMELILGLPSVEGNGLAKEIRQKPKLPNSSDWRTAWRKKMPNATNFLPRRATNRCISDGTKEKSLKS